MTVSNNNKNKGRVASRLTPSELIKDNSGSEINRIAHTFPARDKINNTIEIDLEVRNLLGWIADHQGISPEIALKKAVVTAAYLYDLTTINGNKLLVQRNDNSISEIILK